MFELKPINIRLEASSRCQLKCPACPTASGAILSTIGSGWLKFENFKKIVDKNPSLKRIELSNYGEIFLNPDIIKIMKHAFNYNVILSAENGVNLNTVKDEVLESVVKYGVSKITCSIDGASQETYKIYRVNGNFNTVIENIKKINLFKDKYKTKLPVLVWQYVVFGHNEHEIFLAKQMAQELNMTLDLKLSWDSNFSPVVDQESIKREIGYSSREEFREETGIDYMLSKGICHELWDRPQINWDGKILGCCRNFWGDFGNHAFDDGLSKSLSNSKLNYAKKMLAGKKPPRNEIPCTTCDIYLLMKSNNKWIQRSDTSLVYRVVRYYYHSLGMDSIKGWIKRSVKNLFDR